MPPVFVGMTVVARAVAERTSVAPRSACVCGLAGALLGLADFEGPASEVRTVQGLRGARAIGS